MSTAIAFDVVGELGRLRERMELSQDFLKLLESDERYSIRRVLDTYRLLISDIDSVLNAYGSS